MTLKAGEFYDCYAEKADFHESKTGALSLKVTYRFPQTGDTLDNYHTLVGKDGTIRTFKANPKDPDSPETTEQEVLVKRYGIDLS